MIPPLPDQHYYFDWVDTASARGKPTTSLTVYECVLRSHVFLEILSTEAHAKNRACLEKAVELDPSYVEAWAWLASRYGEEYAFGFNTKPNAMERALETARRAVRLDGANQTARHILAWLLFIERDLELFRIEADLAISLNPNNSLTLADLGLEVAYSGDWEKGLAMVTKAMSLNPHHPGWYYLPFAFDHVRSGNYDAALVEASRVAMPDWHWNYMALGAIYGLLGRQDEAQEAVARLKAVYPGYAANAREDIDLFLYGSPEVVDLLLEGLDKGGLFDEPEVKVQET